MNFYAETALKLKDDLDNCIDRLVDTYFKDKAVPLEYRWAVYVKLSNLLPIETWVTKNAFEYVKGECVCLYDDFNIERHQTVRYVDHVEWLEDDLAYKGEGHEPIFSRSEIDRMKEYVLESGSQGFINDW